MTCMSVVLLVVPRWIARTYTPDEAIIHSTIALLAAGAAFQLFDGIQTVATGALRGLGDTRTPMLCHFTAYWIIGLPLGAWLCFRRGWGAFGLWAGLSLALILIGIVLLFVWRAQGPRLMTLRLARTVSRSEFGCAAQLESKLSRESQEAYIL